MSNEVAKAVVRFVRLSPQKTRLVANLIRGKHVTEAQRILTFSPKRSAKVLLKTLNSAIANAEDKNIEDTDMLLVSKIWIDGGPIYKRSLPRARGRATPIRKPTSHITVMLGQDLKSKTELSSKEVQSSENLAQKSDAVATKTGKEKE